MEKENECNELIKFTSLPRLFFDSSQQSLCCFLSFHEKSLLPFVCWCVGYGGNNVGALSKSTRTEEREKEEGEKKEEKRESRDNGRGGVAGMRTRMGMGGR